ncbi:MAG: hypothetical protein AB7F19_06325 [Candidatus Babeliales bacterium]
MLEQNKKIIQKIIELKKIDILELLRYGLEHKFIDSEFCSTIAIVLLSQNIIIDNTYVLELASLMHTQYENHYERVQALIAEATQKQDNSYSERQQLYNKIWFYLFQLNNLLILEIVQ